MVPEPVVQQALTAARTALWTPTDRRHRVPGITLEGAIRAALDAVWTRDIEGPTDV
jgi:hypothetical protein